ncbi:MAG: GNAT family N-acetyltransferase [Candidatus Poribacteria bacterium]|nr:GNAT family N-acetyltransferase [Candidatus Poribacteria bacterium]
MEKLTPEECLELADVIGDTPTTLNVLDCLKQGMCRAYVFGNLPHITASLVIDTVYDDAFCFATDVHALWHLLEFQTDLERLIINVDPVHAETLGQRISAKTGIPINHHVEIYQALLEPVCSYANEVVRLLTLADVERLAKATAEVQGYPFQIPQETLADSLAAAAIVNDNIVSIARTYAHTDLHGGISVFTLEEWRGKGYATSAASLVAQQIQAMGKVPVWICGEENIASLRTAQKLGFVEISRRIDIVSSSQ